MAAPMIDDIELKAVQTIRQETEQDYLRQRIAGLDGTLHQRMGRRSHRVTLAGFLLADTAADDLGKLQKKAAAGDEITFSADIATALEIEHMVIESFASEQTIGAAGQTAYAIVLAESPPLPPPAEVSSFGGLGDFGVGDLGFDPGALGDVLSAVADQAGAVMGAVDSAISAVEQVSALANLADLGSIGNPVKPVTDALGGISGMAPAVAKIGDAVRGLLG
jgi:hypothetical protein